MRSGWLALLCATLSACGVLSEQSIYEGLRRQERVKSVGAGTPGDLALPDYEQYRRDRDGLKK